MTIKLLYDPEAGRLLGAQVVGGSEGVDKRIDVLATALRGGMTVFDLEHLELAYAPQYGSAKDPVNMVGFAASNIVRGDVQVAHWHEASELRKKGAILLDVRTRDECEAHMIGGAINIPIDELRKRLDELPRGKRCKGPHG